jgi:hypothetical protein
VSPTSSNRVSTLYSASACFVSIPLCSLVALVAPACPTKPPPPAALTSGSWSGTRAAESHFAGQADRCASVGGAIPNFVNACPSHVAASTSPSSASPWPKSRCHDNRLRSHRKLQPSVHRSTSAEPPPPQAPSNSFRILTSPSPSERPIPCLQPLPLRPMSIQCRSRGTRMPVEAPHQGLGRNPSLHCQTSPSILQEHLRAQRPRPHLHTRPWTYPRLLRGQLAIDEVAASSSEAMDALEEAWL